MTRIIFILMFSGAGACLGDYARYGNRTELVVGILLLVLGVPLYIEGRLREERRR